ncbi:unnamed protein product [Adineta steineri]|uniref:Apple domain-containing protein n=2 Tax=Adineta steineri TaxID=433720 RepID=A0A814H1J4_9BILA|nr:unnamed protein product [Adineta steineri]CAF3829884.1 unnamed protein product [Adineta steineri]
MNKSSSHFKLIICLIISCLLTNPVVGGIHWNENWAMGCDFPGNDLSNVQISGEQCGQRCAETNGCTHFAWNNWNGGTCWMKHGSVSKNNAFESWDRNMVCGVLGKDANPKRRTSIGSGLFHGKCTYYYVSAGLTACGHRYDDHQFIVALNTAQFDPHTPNGNPNNNALCGRQIQVNGPRGAAVVGVVDSCPGCPYGGVDLSTAAFQAVVGDLSIGVANVTWSWK